MNTFVSQSGLTADDVPGFNGNSSTNNPLVVKDHAELQANAINQAEILKKNRFIETQNIYSISALKRIIADNHFQLELNCEYGLCLKYGYIILYLSVKRAHIRFNNAYFSAKDGLQYDNDEGGLNIQILSESENKFLRNIEEVFLENPEYVYINHEGDMTNDCSKNNNVSDTAPVSIQNAAWQTPE